LPDPLWDEGHYRTGFRRPSQDINNLENQGFCPASIRPLAQPEENARPTRRQNARGKKTIDWGSNPGQSIVMRRAARERKPQSDMARKHPIATGAKKFSILRPAANGTPH
jgi:hypothetical protein